MRARIALDSPPRISIKEFATAIGRVAAEPLGNPEKVQGAVRIAVGNSASLTITASAQPISIADVSSVVDASEAWGVSSAHLSHQSHVILELKGAMAPIATATLLAKICHAGLQCAADAKAIYWDASGQWIPSDLFRSFPTSVEGLWQMWVTVRTQATQMNQSRGFTCGMHSLGHREIEVRHATEPASELASRIAGVVQYLLDNGAVIQHKDTLGQTAKEKICAHHIEHSEFGIQGKVLLLDYTGAKIIAAPAVPVVPQPIPASQPMQLPAGMVPPQKLGAGMEPQMPTPGPAAWQGATDVPVRSQQAAFNEGVPKKKLWPIVVGVLAGSFLLILGGTALVFMLLGGKDDTKQVAGNEEDPFADAVANVGGDDNGDRNKQAVGNAAKNNGLKYQWDKGTERSYKGELVVQSGGLEIKTTLSFDFESPQATFAGGRKTLQGGGLASIMAFSKVDRQMVFNHNEMLDYKVEVDDYGKANSYSGTCNIPYLGLPVTELVLFDIEPNQKDWTYKWSPKVKTVETMSQVEMRPVVSSQVRYKNYKPGGQERLGRGGRPRNDNPFQAGAGGQQAERVIGISRATEVVSYRIKRESQTEAVVDVEFLLYSDEKPKPDHEIDLKGTYVFNKKDGFVQSINLIGSVKHTDADPTQKADVRLSLNHLTEKDLTEAKRQRDVRMAAREKQEENKREQERKEEIQRIADRERRAKEREMERVAEEAERNGPWSAEKIIDGLASGNHFRQKETVSYLMKTTDASVKNDELSKALVDAVATSTVFMNAPSRLVRTWFDAKDGEELLERMQETDNPIFATSIGSVLRHLDFEGKAKGLIELMGRQRFRGAVSMAMGSLGSEVESEFFDVLDNSEDVTQLSAVLSWIQQHGTRKSLSRVRKLGKRIDDDMIQVRCRILESVLQQRRR